MAIGHGNIGAIKSIDYFPAPVLRSFLHLSHDQQTRSRRVLKNHNQS
jgi:hypothetical protein